MAKISESKIFQLKILLRDTEIWRRFLVRSDILLPELHQIIQTVMGWTNSHLNQFIIDGESYGIPDDEFEEPEIIDYQKIKLNKVISGKGSKFIYEYDFGDCWDHEIKVEEVIPAETGKFYPVCLEGEKACPPEDCGSTPGYEEILNALKDKKNPEYEELLEWLGEEYDPEYFNVEEVNEDLKEEDYGCITLY